MGGFKRSGLFGIVGIFVVAVLVAVIALTTASGDEANPKLTLGLIFAVIALFCVILFALQRSDLNRVAGADAKASARAVAGSGGGSALEDPTVLDEAELWMAMAVKPIDAKAIRAREAGGEAGRRSQNLGMVVVALIFLTVPAIYLTESFVPLMVGGPLIAAAAIYGSVRAVGPGGEMDRGYENVGVAMAPLGLEVTERPTVGVEMRDPVTARMGPKIRGVLELSGARHGKQVTIRLGGGEIKSRSEVRVAGTANAYSAASGKVEVESGPEGILITRKGGGQGDWLCDLWVAERLAAS